MLLPIMTGACFISADPNHTCVCACTVCRKKKYRPTISGEKILSLRKAIRPKDSLLILKLTRWSLKWTHPVTNCWCNTRKRSYSAQRKKEFPCLIVAKQEGAAIVQPGSFREMCGYRTMKC